MGYGGGHAVEGIVWGWRVWRDGVRFFMGALTLDRVDRIDEARVS